MGDFGSRSLPRFLGRRRRTTLLCCVLCFKLVFAERREEVAPRADVRLLCFGMISRFCARMLTDGLSFLATLLCALLAAFLTALTRRRMALFLAAA
jgi:hypothetical protein